MKSQITRIFSQIIEPHFMLYVWFSKYEPVHLSVTSESCTLLVLLIGVPVKFFFRDR